MSELPPPGSSQDSSRLKLLGATRTPTRTSSQIIDQRPKAALRQLSLGSKHDFIESFAPKFSGKRQKLNTTLDGFDRTRGEIPTLRVSPRDAIRRHMQNEHTTHDTSTSDVMQLPLPFPPRPSKSRHSTGCSSSTNSNTKPKDVQAKPYVLEASKSASTYLDCEPTDFFPWNAAHPEDELSEESIKSGFYDKAPALQSELNSARSSIWSSVKHKSGLHILSTLYIAALDRRRDHATVASKSTFKPPPRATLTEPKRELWLKDLADPNVPLRRLSRTIPHGIRGKVLLDQSLAKRIPAWRTVWLAKCVGANEIRAFKRKGAAGAFATGGEAKWVKDWTVSVEQFLGGLIEARGTVDHGSSLIYGLQLVEIIYAEQLLDRDHFLDWTVNSLRAASSRKLLLWLLVVEMLWPEMLRYWERGRKLAASLVEQLSKAWSHQHLAVDMPLRQQVPNVLVLLMLQRPSCFLFPGKWAEYKPILRTCIQDQDIDAKLSFVALDERNASRIKAGIRDPSKYAVNDPRQAILFTLDSFSSSSTISAASRACLDACHNRQRLISITVEWATTRFRPGVSSVYLTARLLRLWAKSDSGFETTFFSCCERVFEQRGFDKLKIFKLVSEMIRSRNISVQKLLQWILAHRISADQSGLIESKREQFAELLDNIPLYDLPSHTLNLRQIIGASLGRDLTTVSEDVSYFKKALLAELQFLRQSPLEQSSSSALVGTEAFQHLSTPARYELLHWLRSCLLSYAFARSSKATSSTTAGSDHLLLVPSDLKRLYFISNHFGDFVFLADLLRVFAEFGELSLLADIAEITNKHFKTLHFIGAAQLIYNTMLGRMQEVQLRSFDQKPLFLALVNLTRISPKRKKTLKILQHELSMCGPKSSLAASSPISESMDEVLQQSNTSFSEEIEMFSNSGANMDRSIFSRLFGSVIRRLESFWSKFKPKISTELVEVLARLRSCNCEYFEGLLLAWFEEIMTERMIPDFRLIVVTFLSHGLIELVAMLNQVVLADGKVGKISAACFLELLAVLCHPFGDCGFPATHRCYVDMERTISTHPILIASLIRTAVERISCSTLALQALAKQILLDVQFQQILWTMAPSSLALRKLQEIHGTSGKEFLSEIIEKAVGFSNLQGLNVVEACQVIIEGVNDYNSELADLRLRLLFDENPSCQDEEYESIAKTIIRKATCSEPSCQVLWKSLLETLPFIVAIKVHALAIDRLVLITPNLETGEQWNAEKDDSERQKHLRVLEIASVSSDCVPLEKMLPTLTVLVDNCIQFLRFLFYAQVSKFDTSRNKSAHSDQGGQINSIIQTRLSIILGHFSISQRLLCYPKVPQEILINLTIALTLISANEWVQAHYSISNGVFDALSLLTGTLNTRARSQCIQSLLNGHFTYDEHLNFVFGPIRKEDGSLLHLVTNDRRSSVLPKTGSFSTENLEEKALPFGLRRWELVQDATPSVGENDASLSLALFDARKQIL